MFSLVEITAAKWQCHAQVIDGSVLRNSCRTLEQAEQEVKFPVLCTLLYPFDLINPITTLLIANHLPNISVDLDKGNRFAASWSCQIPGR